MIFVPIAFPSFSILQDCWKIDPKSRPSFSDLSSLLGTLLTRASYIREVNTIDKKLQQGDLNSAIALPRSTNLSTPTLARATERKSENKYPIHSSPLSHSPKRSSPRAPSPKTSSPVQVPAEGEPAHTSDGYLKVLETAPKTDDLDEEYDYVSTTPKREEPEALAGLKKAEELEEEYDYVHTTTLPQEEPTKDVVSPPLSVSPALYISWGDDDNGYVDVTPKRSPQMSHKHSFSSSGFADAPSQTKGMKQSRSHDNLPSRKSEQKDIPAAISDGV